MDLVFNLNGSITFLDVSIVAPFSCNPSLVSAGSTKNQDLRPRERRRPNLTGTHTSIWSRSFLRQQADLVHMPGNSLTTYCEMLTTHQLLSDTLGPPSEVFSTMPSPNNNLRQPLRDFWGLLSHSVDLNAWCLWVLVPSHRECTKPFSVSSLLHLCHVALL